MTAVLRALLPLFALIAVGYVARLAGWPKPPVWRAVERLTYYVLFPALLFTSLATTSLAGGGRIAVALAVAVIFTAALSLLVRKPLRVSGATFSSVLQGAVRPNTYVGVGAALALWGSHGVALAAVGLATVIPIVNVISVVGLIHYAGGGAKRRLSPVAALALNPLILSCFAGLVANGLAWHPPVWIMGALKLLGQASLPLGLLAVGAALQLSGFRARLPAVGAACAFKLAVAPTLTALLLALFGVRGLAFTVAAMYMGVPASASSYVLAVEMGGDRETMATIVSVSTILSALTLPAVVLLAR